MSDPNALPEFDTPRNVTERRAAARELLPLLRRFEETYNCADLTRGQLYVALKTVIFVAQYYAEGDT